MDTQDSSTFKINSGDNIDLDEAEINSHPKDDILHNRIDKLRNKITLLSIILPCLIGIIIFLAYLEFTKTSEKLSNASISNMSNFTKDMESKFTRLSIQADEIKNSFNTNNQLVKKKITDIENSLKNSLKKIKRLNLSKTDIKKFTKTANITQKKIKKIKNDLAQFSLDNKNLVQNLVQKLNESTSQAQLAQKEIEELKGDVSFLSSSKIGKKQLTSALSKQQNDFNHNLIQTTDKFEQKIAQIEKQIKSLNKAKDKYDKDMKKYLNMKDKSKKYKKSGSITEQDIK